MREGGPIALVIAAAILLFLAILPFLLAVGIWTVLSVYALVKGSAFETASVNVAAMLAAVASLVVAFLVLLAAGVGLAGRALGPVRRRRADEAQDFGT